MMNHLYIFLTCNIFAVGGVQPYVAAKARYLLQAGWNVVVFYNEFAQLNHIYKQFEACKTKAFPELSMPPFHLAKNQINHSLSLMQKSIGDPSSFDLIYIESHDDKTSQWGELLAHSIGAKHVIRLMNETYRGQNKFYQEKLEFYSYKLDRGELFGKKMIPLLFEGYRVVNETDLHPFWINESPVQDIYNELVDQIKQLDWNICYIGRFSKPYVPEVLKGIRRFADGHREKKIQLIIVGDTGKSKMLEQVFKESPNVSLLELGNVIPLPKSLFTKLDVVIAGAGSARCSAMEGVPTIMADPVTCKATGLLGYETIESTYWDGESPLTGFDEALERALVQRVYVNKAFRYTEPSAEECILQNLEAIAASDQTRNYYPAKLLCEGEKTIYKRIMYWGRRISNHLPSQMTNLIVYAKRNYSRVMINAK